MHWIFITSLLLSLAVPWIDAEIEISFSINGIIRENDELTITCTIPEYNRLELLKLVREIDSKRIDVAVNGGLTDNFEKPGRYEVINSEENLQNGLQVVKISGVTGGDRGMWLCIHITITKETESAVESIEVVVPPATVVLSQMSHQGTYVDVEDGETLVFPEEQEAGMKCIVHMEGTLKQPNVEIKLGDQDITDTFDVKSSELASVVDGLYMESVDVTYSGYGQPKSEDNGKQLTCTASSENHSETRSSSVIVEVHYKPRLSCSQSEVEATLGDEAYLSCVAEMMPKYQEAVWNTGNESLSPDDSSADGNLHFMARESGESYSLKLHMKSVRAEDFRDYTLEVTNSQGSASASVQLTEAVEPETQTPEPSTSTVQTEKPATVRDVVADNGSAHLTPLSLLTLLLATAAFRLL